MLLVCAGYLGLLLSVKILSVTTATPRAGTLLSTTRSDRVVAQPSPLRPVSETCKQFPYERYHRASDFDEMRALGRRARPGDMIELAAGVHAPHRAAIESTEGEGVCATWPTRALDGTVFKLHGEPGRVITFCGDKERTIVDGRKGLRKGGAGLQIVQSSYVRFAGFTIRNLLRAVDIQDTSHAEILYITSEKTWHEGFRVRYNSSSNLIQVCIGPRPPCFRAVASSRPALTQLLRARSLARSFARSLALQHNHIKDTGLGYVGNGEAIYVGTARGRTTDCGNPQDNSDYNVIASNRFGPGVPSENIDVKEYTHGGVIKDNVFNGTGLQGIHASTSWVALKGTGYVVSDNVGVGLGVTGAGIRVLERVETFGSNNMVVRNTCKQLSTGSVCVFVDARTSNNTLSGNRVVDSDESVRVSNLVE